MSRSRPSVAGSITVGLLLGCLLLVGVNLVLKAAEEEPYQNEVASYERANVKIIWEGESSPDISRTLIYTGKRWVPSNEDGQIVLTDRGPALELVGDERVIRALITYGGNQLSSAVEFPWNGRGVIPPFNKVPGNNDHWHKLPLTRIAVLATTSRHPFEEFVLEKCVGFELGFKCGQG